MNDTGSIDVNVFETHIQPSKDKALAILDKYKGNAKEFFQGKKNWYSWQTYLGDEVDIIFDDIRDKEEEIRKCLVTILVNPRSNKPHPKSIVWEALDIMSLAHSHNLVPDDLPHLRKFLLTPPGKELEGWAEWEAYWSSRHSPKE